MKEIINSKNLKALVESSDYTFELTDDDVVQINKIIIDAFKYEWRVHPEAKCALLKRYPNNYQFNSIVELLNWNYEKKVAFKDYIDALIKDRGFQVYGDSHRKSLYIKLIK